MKTLRNAGPAARLLLLAILLTLASHSRAGLTDIATAPLATSASVAVLPNVLFVLDDSASMDNDSLPDWANDKHCRKTTGLYTAPCCRDSNGVDGGSRNGPCWRDVTAPEKWPFGSWRGAPPYLTSDFNSLYYNPAIHYAPPVNGDGTRRPNQTDFKSVPTDAYGLQNPAPINLETQFPDAEWCISSTSSDCLTNGNYILPGTVNGKDYHSYRPAYATGKRDVANGTPGVPVIETSRKMGPHYYAIMPGEYCDNVNLRNCQTSPSPAHIYSARLRWCNSVASTTADLPAAGTCQAVRTPVYQYPRYPPMFVTPGVPGTPAMPAVPAAATFTIAFASGCTGSSRVGYQSVSANGVNLLGGSTGQHSSANNLASDVRTRINNNSASTGYSASGANNSVTITAAVAAGNITYPVIVTRTATSTAGCATPTSPTAPAFAGYRAGTPAAAAIPAAYSGRFVRVDITDEVSSYPMPGSTSKSADRVDCAGTTCTYTEEMTNFANWWAYYHTRLQTAKSSASISFGNLDARYRVGYFTINQSTNANNALKIADFDATQRQLWYGKLFAAAPNSNTPLQEALARAGRIYAGKLGNTVGGADPMQYSCQQNFTIMMTDGEWSDNRPGVKINGTSQIGDQDSASDQPRPKFDGTATANTLADVAAYYYDTDLRDTSLNNCTGAVVGSATVGNNVCATRAPTSKTDTGVDAYQRMSTFTVGFGLTGYMQFSPDYEKAMSGDFFSVKRGVLANPADGVCNWQNSGECNWAVPNNTPGKLDDIWHAAVNGNGRYFSAGDPTALSLGLSSALTGLSTKPASAAAATTSNPNIVAGDNYLFSSTYVAQGWYGQLERQQVNPDTGAVSPTKDWSAQLKLDSNPARRILTYDPNTPASLTRLKPFNWNNMTDGEKAYFSKAALSGLTQFCASGATCLSSKSQDDASNETIVRFLAGHRGDEGAPTDTKKFFRERMHLLGDIVSSAAVYVQAPQFTYSDDGYVTFKNTQTGTRSENGVQLTGRQGMVYVAANDGMLHAFNSDTGDEVWAYVPSLVLPQMHKLADKNYDAQHSYLVDGTPYQGDVYFDGAWRTILVGGLNRGGRGYYALDITIPGAPKALWEFRAGSSDAPGYTTDPDLGYSFGKAEITKLADGTWVVLVSSGLNNVPVNPGETGDGKGYLYVLNAQTGALIRKMSTGVGSVDTPSGLTHIRAWADNSMFNNTTQRVYGGDMLGNLWRFDINNAVGQAGYDTFLLATLRDGANTAQPLSAKPELGDVNGHPMVYVGTGRYLGLSDVSDTGVQTIYAIKDNLSATAGYGNIRNASGLVRQTLTVGTCPSGSTGTCVAGQQVMTGTSTAVDMDTDNGWFVDLPSSGERANTDPQLALGTLTFTTNIPTPTACKAGGSSNIYFFDYRSGAPVSTSLNGVAGVHLSDSTASQPVLAGLVNNTVVAYVHLGDASTAVQNVPVGAVARATRRLSWRVLINEN